MSVLKSLRNRLAGSLSPAVVLILLFGAVSLFADMTYEAARSVTGPYLRVLGANAVIVGVVAGVGEFIGYGLRLATGYLSDRTNRYWTFTVGGYVLNLFAVPLLAVAGSWPLAALFIIAERTGKAVRTPARDTMLSHATAQTGRGWGFGVHEALDQLGAVIGPLLVAGVLTTTGSYRLAFTVLAIPAILAVAVLLATRVRFPETERFETESESEPESASPTQGTGRFSRAYWVYLIAIGLFAAGFADFALIAFHFRAASVFPVGQIPLLYALAMGIDGVAALVLGRLFDSFGAATLVIVIVVSALFAPLVFLGGTSIAVVGIGLWGVGMAARESVIRAVVADLIPVEQRGTSYGIFDTGYGLAWFLGSALMGVLYTVSLPVLVVFSVGIQLTAIPVVLTVRNQLG